MAEEAHVVRAWRLQLLTGRQRHFALLRLIVHPRHEHGQLLVREIDRPGLLAPPHDTQRSTTVYTPRVSQRCDFGLQYVLDCLESKWD